MEDALAPDGPRSLRSADERGRRRSMLGLGHIAPLSSFTARLREQGRGSVPNFDPFDGGTAARALFLMEKPGPMTDAREFGKRRGSGFVSMDNDDPTAEAIYRFMELATIPRSRVILWNLVPWWNGTRRLTSAETRDGAAALADLTALLPELRAVVLVGRRAAREAGKVEALGLQAFVSAHPSPIVRASRPETWKRIPEVWRQVVPLIAQDDQRATGAGHRE